MPMYKFVHSFRTAVLAALGLQDRRIKKLTLVMEYNEPVILTIEEYASLQDHTTLTSVLRLATFTESKPDQDLTKPNTQ